ncbi:MAG: type II toxin-antitoxin system VapC family toxin [Candidatus Methylomirabilales bacterium]
MDVILDTSVVVKWFIQPPEEDIEIALEIRDRIRIGAVHPIFPDLLLYELINVLHHQPELTSEDVAAALDSLEEMTLDLHPFSSALGKEATRISANNRVSAYDAYFIALAEALECPLVTADRRCYLRVRDRGSVILLRNWTVPERT